MSQFPVDVDAEAVFFEGAWYTRDDLSRRLREMLDAGDFNVAQPSAALQDLNQTMATVRTLAFRATPDLADALAELSNRLGQSVGFIIREAVTQYITDATSSPPGQVTQPRMVVTPASPSADLPADVVEAEVDLEVSPPVVAGPGALRAAGLDPDEVAKKHATPVADEKTEQRWFT